MDWRAVGPVYTVAVKPQRAVRELILTEEMVVTAKARMFSCCSQVLLNTQRSSTYSNLAITPQIDKLQTRTFSSVQGFFHTKLLNLST